MGLYSDWNQVNLNITLCTTHFQSIQTIERRETIIMRTKFESLRHDSLSLYLSGKSNNM